MKKANWKLGVALWVCASFVIFLGLASAYRTGLGLTVYTVDVYSSIFMTIGVQGFMIVASYIISQLDELFTPVFWVVFLTYLLCMLISIFFSFASFYENVETEKAQRAQANIVLQSEWGAVYSKVNDIHIAQILNQSKALIKGENFENWRDDYQTLITESETYIKSAKLRFAQLNVIKRSDQAERKNQIGEIDIKIDTLEDRVDEFDNVRTSLSRRISSATGLARSKEIEYLAKEEKADSELKDGGGIDPISGAITASGDGPVYRAVKAEAAQLKQEFTELNARLQGLIAQRKVVDEQLQAVRNELLVFKNEKQVFEDPSNLSQLSPEQREQLPYSDVLDDIDTLLKKRPIEKLPKSISIPQDGVTLQEAISEAVAVCFQMTEKIKIFSAGIEALGLENGISAKLPSIVDCSIDSSISIEGNTLASRVGELKDFQSTCDQNTFPNGYSTGQIFAALNNSRTDEYREITALAGLSNPTSENINEFYVNNREKFEEIVYRLEFDKVVNFITDCLQRTDMDSIEDLQFAKTQIQNQLLNYNPDVHDFTRAVAAFQADNKTAYLAAFSALALDMMILLAGFVGYNVNKYVVERVEIAELTVEQTKKLDNLMAKDIGTILDIVRMSKDITKTNSAGDAEVWYKFSVSQLKSKGKLSTIKTLAEYNLAYPTSSTGLTYEMKSTTLRYLSDLLTNHGLL